MLLYHAHRLLLMPVKRFICYLDLNRYQSTAQKLIPFVDIFTYSYRLCIHFGDLCACTVITIHLFCSIGFISSELLWFISRDQARYTAWTRSLFTHTQWQRVWCVWLRQTVLFVCICSWVRFGASILVLALDCSEWKLARLLRGNFICHENRIIFLAKK